MGSKKYKWYKVASAASDLQWTSGDISEVEVEGKKYCVGRHKSAGDGSDEWYGFAHTCPHAGAPMIDAYVAGSCQVVCPVHHLKFNMKNGRDINGEGYTLKIYPVEVRPDGIYFGLEEGGGFFSKWF